MDRRQWARSEMEEIPFKENKISFHRECGEVLEQAVQRGCGVSTCGDVLVPAGCSPGQAALSVPALSSVGG